MEELSSTPHSNSAARAIAIVEFLASRPGQTFSLSDIARQCGLRKSTAYTILGTLHESGWVTRSPADLRYALGPSLIAVGQAAEETRPEVNLARPVMEALAIELQRELVFSTAVGDEIVVLESTGVAGMRGRSLHPGQRVPLVAPFGTVFIAWQGAADRAEWYARSGVTDTEQMRVLERILDATVRRGYVVTLKSDPYDRMARVISAVAAEKTIQDVRRTLKEQISQLPPVAYLVDEGVAHEPQVVDSLQAPIFDSDGAPRYALTVNNVDMELEPKKLARFGARVRAAADEVTSAVSSLARQRSRIEHSR
jgi:DNA-binding IclR family transcriptional regulator